MADHQRLTPGPAEPAVAKYCWMCGIHLSAGQMVADGGTACADVRWYCLDMRGCTDRWTSRSARQAGLGQGSARTTKMRSRQLAAWSAGTGSLCSVSHRTLPGRHLRGGTDPAWRLEAGWAGRPGR